MPTTHHGVLDGAHRLGLPAAARAVLARYLEADGPVGGGGGLTGHRGVMAAVKAAVVATLVPDGEAAYAATRADGGGASAAPRADGYPVATVEAASRWLTRLEELQAPSGLFSSGDNLASPPDSAFTLTDVGLTLAVLRAVGRWPDDLPERLEGVLRRALPAVTTGGVHTPNHRWEISGALARAGELLGGSEGAAALARAQEWLTEGVDVDADGLYSERSPNYAAHVSNPSLLTLARTLDRADLRDVVHTNLHTLLDLATPDGRTETVHSRRQDQKSGPFPLGPFLGHVAVFAEACERCRAAAAWVRDLPGVDPVDVLAHALVDADVAAGLALAADAAPRSGATPTDLARRALGEGRRWWAGPRLLREWSAEGWTLAYGGSDVPATGRVASGLACNPTFLRVARGDLEVSVRLARDFFGLGPFRAQAAHPNEHGLALEESLAAGYYQPLPPALRRADADYRLEFEGRFAAAMAFSDRAVDLLHLTTRVSVAVVPASETDLGGVDLVIDTEGPATPHALELALSSDVRIDGAAPAGPDAVRLSGSDVAVSTGATVLTVDASPDGDDALPAVYSPGEAYEFLGGTDAVGGTRLYVTWSSPGTQRVALRFAHP
ncbi:hypothetical protein FH969_14055 [Miniimonas arenae]|uniref:Uncharacterized protein n=1 Tax=Miniimonas arenae TaxID=676201 RepID=A0A5C5BAG1_9MICO|nr:hypothetical protein [Miniimonas arenae]TNU72935.1 hypothetical protein FH969_14055 [Miniimonas arenae]